MHMSEPEAPAVLPESRKQSAGSVVRRTTELLNEHRIAEGKHAVLVLDGVAIRFHDVVAVREGAYEHHQGRARHVEIGDQRIYHMELVAGKDEQAGGFPVAGQHFACLGVPRRFEAADAGGAHGNDVRPLCQLASVRLMA